MSEFRGTHFVDGLPQIPLSKSSMLCNKPMANFIPSGIEAGGAVGTRHKVTLGHQMHSSRNRAEPLDMSADIRTKSQRTRVTAS